jgi:gluconate 5-dehydrogenase
LRAAGLAAEPLAFDVADTESAESAIERIALKLGRLDILINNVGMRLREDLERISPSDFVRMFSVNVAAAYAISRRAVRFMRAAKHGRIIMIASISGMRAKAGDCAYIASKGGLISLTLALANELGPHGITCNAIAPGVFNTAVNAAIVARDSPRLARIPLRRAGEPHELAGAAVFLASEAGSYVNGHVLVVDGGSSTVL